ncbi:MAG: hypothetical protein K2G83_00080, partial [Ruminococcus sp.]|nr:hypothetical protein [Ruminococcus sp.]
MKKIAGKIIAAISAAALSVVPMINGFSASAAATKYKTYVIYSVANNPNIAYFDFALNYGTNVTAEKSKATYLCKNGYFSSSDNGQRILSTYNGPAIGATGNLCETKFIVPMNTDSIYDVVSLSNVVVRNASGVTLAPTSIYMEEILLGDVDMNGVVDDRDSDLILNSIVNPDNYK